MRYSQLSDLAAIVVSKYAVLLHALVLVNSQVTYAPDPP